MYGDVVAMSTTVPVVQLPPVERPAISRRSQTAAEPGKTPTATSRRSQTAAEPGKTPTATSCRSQTATYARTAPTPRPTARPAKADTASDRTASAARRPATKQLTPVRGRTRHNVRVRGLAKPLRAVVVLLSVAIVAVVVVLVTRGSHEDSTPALAAVREPAAKGPGPVLTLGHNTTGPHLPPGFVGFTIRYPVLEQYVGSNPKALDPPFLQLLEGHRPQPAPRAADRR